MKLYIGDYNLSSWSLRPWLALTVAGARFDTERIRLDRPNSRASLLAVSPTGKVPALDVGGGVTVWDSLAICELAAERYPDARLWPADPTVRAVARSASAEMHAGFAALRQEHPMNFAARTPRAPSASAAADIARIGALWADLRSRFGASGPFLFGAFSIADAMYAPVVSRIRTYALPVDAAGQAYCAAIWALPAMAAWGALAQAELDDGDATVS